MLFWGRKKNQNTEQKNQELPIEGNAPRYQLFIKMGGIGEYCHAKPVMNLDHVPKSAYELPDAIYSPGASYYVYDKIKKEWIEILKS